MAGSGTYTTYNSNGSVKSVQTATQYRASNAAAISSGQDTPVGVSGTIQVAPAVMAAQYNTPAPTAAPAPSTLFYGVDKNGNPVYESSSPSGVVDPSKAIAAPYSTSSGQSQAITQNAPAVIASGYNSSMAISAASLNPVTPFNPATYTYDPTSANNAMSGLTAGNATYDAQQQAKLDAASKLGPKDTQLSDLINQSIAENNQLAGKQDYQNQQNAQDLGAGGSVDQMTKTVNDLRVQQQQLLNEHAAAQLQTQSGSGVTTAIDTRQRNEETRVNAIKALSISSLIAAAQGNLTYAQALADKAVAQKFGPIEAKLAANTANILLIKSDPATTVEEQKRADAISVINDQNKATVAKAKENSTAVSTVAITAASYLNNFVATSQYSTSSQALQAIQNAPDPVTAQTIATQTGLVAPVSKGLPASAQEYEYAKSQGYTGTFQQYQNEDANRKARAGGGNVGGDNTKSMSVLDVARYNELYPDAGVTAGDTEAQANAKVNASNSPEAKTRNLVVAAQTAGNSYDTVVKEINGDASIKDKASALAVAKEVYGVQDVAATPIEAEITRLKAGGILSNADIRSTLVKKYGQQAVNNSSVGSILDQIGSFLFGNK